MRAQRIALICAIAAVSLDAHAATVAARAEVKAAYGITDVRLGKQSLRIVRAQVGNGTATSFDTFTVYLMPEAPGEPWMQVTTGTPKGIGYNFRTYESGDANTQAVAFYVEDKHLFVVQATKVGQSADAKGARRTPFDFDVVRFNENGDIPLFDDDAKRRSKGLYVDGSEAIEHEFFGHRP